MQIILKREGRLSPPASTESKHVANVIRRRIRAQCRAVQKVIVKNGQDLTCTICIEPIECMLDCEATTCGHIFHKACFELYRKEKVMSEIEAIRVSSVYETDEDHFAVSKSMIRVLVNYDTGFHCPTCRCAAPLVHVLARRSCRSARTYDLGGVNLQLTPSDVLDLAKA